VNRFLGIALIVLALGIGIVPHYTDCLSQGNTVALANGKTQPMKCHWTAQGEIAVAAPLAALGIVATVSRRKETLRGSGALGIVLGAVALALPLNLIGTCAMPTHICNTAMKPSILALGSLAIVGSLGVMLVAQKAKN
jgi:hypothetical protein